MPSPAEWFDMARRDAQRRGLPELAPLLTALQASIERLRSADWNEDFGPAAPQRRDERRGSTSAPETPA
jgi:hypothetical protein